MPGTKPLAAQNPILSLYLNEAARYPLLGRQGEIKLAKEMKKYRKKKDMKKYYELRDKFANSNLRWVVYVAKYYQQRSPHFELLDLIQEGNQGLLKAVERFDHRKGFKFTTYATYWIRQAISRSLEDRGKMIRLPINKAVKVYQYRKKVGKLSQELGRAPSHDEIIKKLDLNSEQITKLETWSYDVEPLDAKPERAIEKITISDDQSSHDLYEQTALKGAVIDKLDLLDPRYKFIIIHRFGLMGNPASTLEEVGTMLKLSRERIRQLQNEALEKLRRRGASLKEFYPNNA